MIGNLSERIADWRSCSSDELNINYKERISRIRPADRKAGDAARRRWQSIAKPLGSLGLLEEDIARMAQITGDPDVRMDRSALFIFCADNGVVKEGVTQTGQDVTASVTEVIGRDGSCSAHMSRVNGTEVYAVDLGVASAMNPEVYRTVAERRIRRGTSDFLEEPAMTEDEARMAVLTGIDCARAAKEAGMDIILGGEMGIGNTTTGSAVACALLDADPGEITGKGAGFTDEGLRHKIDVVGKGVALHRKIYEKNGEKDALQVLRCVGGFDIAALCGLYLGAAIYRIPAVIDGFIASAAALAAVSIAPDTREFLLASHMSGEGGMKRIMEKLDIVPPISAGLHLGEGTGALMLLPLLRMTLAVYRNMMTFDGMGIDAYRPL